MSRPGWRAFFDANMSPRLGKMIYALEEGVRPVVHARDHPILRANNTPEGNSTPDIEWIELLGAEGDWVAISGDTDIIDTSSEREVLNRCGLTFFAFDGYFANATKYGQALHLDQMWPQIVQRADAGEQGIFLVRPKQEEIRQILPGFSSKAGGCKIRPRLRDDISTHGATHATPPVPFARADGRRGPRRTAAGRVARPRTTAPPVRAVGQRA